MWFELFLLLTLSILTARFLERRYKVASIAHSILFIFMLTMYVIIWDFEPIKNMWITYMGKEFYEMITASIKDPLPFFNISISSFMLFEIVIFILMPILSFVAFVESFKEQIKKLVVKLRYRDQYISSQINLGINPTKDFIDTYNETYLVFGKLLN